MYKEYKELDNDEYVDFIKTYNRLDISDAEFEKVNKYINLILSRCNLHYKKVVEFKITSHSFQLCKRFEINIEFSYKGYYIMDFTLGSFEDDWWIIDASDDGLGFDNYHFKCDTIEGVNIFFREHILEVYRLSSW